MRFLADESCDFRVVKALREAGYDVKAIAEMKPGISDDEVAGLSVCEMRILITEDKDFGQLVYTNLRLHAVLFLSAFRQTTDRIFLITGTDCAVISVNHIGTGLCHDSLLSA